MFHAKAKQKPEGRIVHADKSVDVKAGVVVIPRTTVLLTKFSAGEVFCGKDRAGVKNTPGKHRGFLLL